MKVLMRVVKEVNDNVDPADLISFKEAADQLGMTINGMKSQVYRKGLTILYDGEKLDSYRDRTYLFKSDMLRLKKKRAI